MNLNSQNSYNAFVKHFTELKEAELLQDRINALESVQSFVGTFFSKEFILKKVLRMNDAEIDEMRKQIQRETEIDPMDGGIDMPDGGDGITRYPQDAAGGIISPEQMPDYEDPEQDGKPNDDQKFGKGDNNE